MECEEFDDSRVRYNAKLGSGCVHNLVRSSLSVVYYHVEGKLQFVSLQYIIVFS